MIALDDRQRLSRQASYPCTRLKWTCAANNIRPVKELDSYLDDHLAGSVSALELVAHWAHVHKDEPLGAFFAEIEREIKADQHKLRDVMRSLEIEESKMRQAGAWAAEKLGRARLIIAGDEAGRLGLVQTWEGLIMGVTGRNYCGAHWRRRSCHS